MTGWDGNALRVADRDQFAGLIAPKVAAIIAIGSCAVDGGWVSPTKSRLTGVTMYLMAGESRRPSSTCLTPSQPEWIVAMVVDVLLLGERRAARFSTLDARAAQAHLRPDDPGGARVVAAFENGEFVYQFGSRGGKGYCLYRRLQGRKHTRTARSYVGTTRRAGASRPFCPA
jgi:Ni,Fe-hydrogenase I small subunit